MPNEPVDFYELLQISPNAEPETISRVYRLLAQRFHPDNKDTGSAERFRLVCQAYEVLSDPGRRAEYDVSCQQLRQSRWRLVSEGVNTDNQFEMEQAVRLTVLEVLYTHRRTDPGSPGLFPIDLEEMIGAPREHIDFTLWFLVQKKLVQRSDGSNVSITADGAEYLERNFEKQRRHRRRLRASTQAT